MDSLSQLDEGRASTTLIGWRGDEARDVGMVTQQTRNCATQRAGAMAVDDAHLTETRQRCFVEKLVYRVDRFVGRLADDV